jgi:GTP pyrophosphokinase
MSATIKQVRATEQVSVRDKPPTIEDLLEVAAAYSPEQDLDLIRRAYDYALSAHQGQKRRSGEDYIIHPLAVALILADLRLDTAAVAAGLLHDVLEDTKTTAAKLAELFSPEISKLVDGVTKLTRLDATGLPERRGTADLVRHLPEHASRLMRMSVREQVSPHRLAEELEEAADDLSLLARVGKTGQPELERWAVDSRRLAETATQLAWQFRSGQFSLETANEPLTSIVDGLNRIGRSIRPVEDKLRADGAAGQQPQDAAVRAAQMLREEEGTDRAESLRKMLLAMAEDVRVVLIKLADRLHNMATLIYLAPAKRRRMAQETLDIYAPLASRLGIWQLKWQLEDLSFRHLEPGRYKEIASQLASTRGARERHITECVESLRAELERVGIRADISGRPKHFYSIYKKMQSRSVDFTQIYDLHAVRVLVDELNDCYSALGVVHSVWHPIPGQFDDYISMPKESLYQSLHTTVIGPGGLPLEIQIRTHEMHRVAELGVAAHWRYKEGTRRDARFEQKIAWLRQLLDWQKEVAGAQDFVDTVQRDVFRDQVYVFTPRGEIRELPAGSTPLDFAYRIHTDVGHRCIGAKVNQRLVPLDGQLSNGDIVEIVTSKSPKGPSRDWLNPSLNFVRTAHAREKIQQWFRRQQREENIDRGREVLDRELRRLGLTNSSIVDIAEHLKFDKTEDLLVAIGTGDLSPQAIATRLVPSEQPQQPQPGAELAAPPPPPSGKIQVMGVGDLLSRLARCCNPVPGEPIVGFITRGKGVTVHRADCPNVVAEDERERLVTVEWGRVQQEVFPVNIRLDAWDRDGLLRDVAAVVAEDHVNMSTVTAQVHPDRTAIIRATIEISGIAKLSRIFSRLEGLKGVIGVRRETA